MKRYLKRLHSRLFGHLATKADLENLYLQFSSLLEIRDVVGPGIHLGLRGWALSPDALLLVLRDILLRKAPQVVEFGSGESTLAVAATLARKGAGSLITVEHNRHFADRTLDRLRDAGLHDRAEVIVAPLRPYEARYGLPEFHSYDLDTLDIDFDVGLVDGPVTPEFGAASRAVPLEWSLARLRREGVVYLDDAARSQEQAVIQALRDHWPDVDIEYVPTEKGLAKITCGGHATVR